MDELLNNAPCGFLTLADDGTIRAINATLCDLLEYDRAELQNHPVGDILAVGGRIFWQTHFFPLLRLQGWAQEIYLTLRTKAGSDVPVLVNAVRRRREDVAVTDCVFVVMRQRHQYEGELLRAKKAAEEAIAEAVRANAREHRIASQLQTALQPELPDQAPGLALAHVFQPAWELSDGVGGDFLDVFALDDGSTALVVGDLSGKGLAAAAQVATVRNMLRAFLYTRATLAEAVTTLNDVLAGHDLLTGFATLFVGAYDGDTRTLRYVGGGQEPALIRRAASGVVEELAPTGPVVGAIEGAIFGEARVTLLPDDALAIFTDGLTEAGANRTTMLGIQGVSALLGELLPGDHHWDSADTAERLARHLITGVEEAAQGDLRDDVCLLVGVVES